MISILALALEEQIRQIPLISLVGDKMGVINVL